MKGQDLASHRFIIKTYGTSCSIRGPIALAGLLRSLPILCILASIALIALLFAKTPLALSLDLRKLASIISMGILLGLFIVQLGVQLITRPYAIGQSNTDTGQGTLIDWRYVLPTNLALSLTISILALIPS